MKTTVHDPLEFEVLAGDLGFPEGPVITDDGTVFVVDIDGCRVMRLARGETTVVAMPGGGPNGMALETPTTALVANNGAFLWTEVNGNRIPIVVVTPDGSEVDVHPVPGDVTTNIAFGGADRRRAVITLSRTGRVVETRWPRPGLVLRVGRR